MDSMKSVSRRAAFVATFGMLALHRLSMGERVGMGLGFIKGDQFYKFLPYKRVKGKWRVKH